LSALPQGKSSWYPLDRKLRRPQNRSGHGGEEKNSQPMPRLEPSTVQPVAQSYTAELSRLPIYVNVYKLNQRIASFILVLNDSSTNAWHFILLAVALGSLCEPINFPPTPPPFQNQETRTKYIFRAYFTSNPIA
jgi:hypothetical protein